MVIQGNMTPKAIIEIWADTKKVFRKYDLPVSSKSLSSIISDKKRLQILLNELNHVIGSTYNTCIEGG